jgi:hypothetical protein
MLDSADCSETRQAELQLLQTRRRLPRSLLAVMLGCLISSAALAQQSQPGSVPDAPSPAQQTAPQTNPTQSPNALQTGVSMFLELQNKSIIFPDLATTKGPLDSWEKLKLAANNSVAVPTVASALIGAGFGQAIDSPSGYDQGVEGYGKRFGANMARSASNQFFGTFVLASAFHQDPRFYVKKDLSFQQSVEYAAARVFYTRSDSGAQVVNYSGLLGALAAEGLANAYYPENNRSAANTFTRFAIDLGARFGGHLLRQYWPEINKRLALSAEPKATPDPSKP